MRKRLYEPRNQFCGYIKEDSFNELLRKYRKINNFSIKDVCNKLDIPQTTYPNYEQPGISNMPLDTLIKLNKHLRLDFFQSLSLLGYHSNKVDFNGIFAVPEITYKSYIVDRSKLRENLEKNDFEFVIPKHEHVAFGEKIKLSRKEIGITQMELAKFIELAPSSLSKLEKNDTKNISPQLFSRIINFLRIDPMVGLVYLTDEDFPLSTIELDSFIMSSKSITIAGKTVTTAQLREIITNSKKLL